MSLIPCTDDCLYQKDGCCHLQYAASSGTLATPVSEMIASPGSAVHPDEPGRMRCVHYTRRPR
ncbi:MAG: hypothetical protein GX189_00210 [Clostridiales bacterium]|nr:hypothetical protein [Clostridiales bacterium]